MPKLSQDVEDSCWCLCGLMSIPGVFCLVGLCSYWASFDEIIPQKYSEVDRWVQEVPSLKPMVVEAMKEGHINRHEYNKIENAHGWAAKRKYAQ